MEKIAWIVAFWYVILSVSVPEIKAGSGGGFIKASEFKDTTRLFRDFG